MRNQVSDPYKTVDKVMLLKIFIFVYTEWEDMILN